MLNRKLLGLLCVLVATSPAAHAVSYGFQNITRNSAANAAAGEAQLFMDVTDAGSGRVSFVFTNLGPAASSITDVYFDDGTLLGISSVINGPGVNFSEGAAPKDLPGRNNIDPRFRTTKDFSADSNPPTQPNGVNPGERLELITELINGRTFADTIAALAAGGVDGGLRVGIHVQGFANGGSESFVNGRALPPPPPPGPVVPEPSSALLAAIAFGMVGGSLRRRSRG